MYWHLHPPVLRALGLRRKLRLGPWFRPVLLALRGMRGIRGTRLDLFGATSMRRVERELVGEYIALVDRALRRLNPDNRDQIVALVSLVRQVRGYEHIKTAGISAYRAEVAEMWNGMG